MANVLNKDPFTYDEDRRKFLQDLKRFHASRGTPFDRVPKIEGIEVDLYRLYRRVIDLGGLQKVNNGQLWEDIQEEFKVPEGCANGTQALKYVYYRYLCNYEKVKFWGLNLDDIRADEGPARKKVCLPIESVPLSYNYSQHNVSDKDRAANKLSTSLAQFSDYNKLEMSLRSGLPNEVDFALNICTLLSREGSLVLKLNKARHLVPLLMATVGIFEKGPASMESVMVYNWNSMESKLDFLRFWLDVVQDEKIREFIRSDNSNSRRDEMVGSEVLQLSRELGSKDAEGQRVKQLAVMIRNLSFEDVNQQPLASNNLVFRFLMLCVYSSYGNLRHLALDAMGNLAAQMVLQPQEATSTQLLMNMIKKLLVDDDTLGIVRALEILSGLCQLEQNEAVLNESLEGVTYSRIVQLLLIPDIQLIVYSLEALYQLSELGETTTTLIAHVRNAVDILVNMITVEVQSFSPDSLCGIRVVQHIAEDIAEIECQTSPQSSQFYIEPVPPWQTPDTTALSSPQPLVAVKQPTSEVETTASNWLTSTFEVKADSWMSQAEVYTEYQQLCKKFGMVHSLTLPHLVSIVRWSLPEVSVAEADKEGGGKEAVFQGLCKRSNPKPFAIMATSNKGVGSTSPPPPVTGPVTSSNKPTLAARLFSQPTQTQSYHTAPTTAAPAQPSGPGPGHVSPVLPGRAAIGPRQALKTNILNHHHTAFSQQGIQVAGTPPPVVSSHLSTQHQMVQASCPLFPALSSLSSVSSAHSSVSVAHLSSNSNTCSSSVNNTRPSSSAASVQATKSAAVSVQTTETTAVSVQTTESAARGSLPTWISVPCSSRQLSQTSQVVQSDGTQGGGRTISMRDQGTDIQVVKSLLARKLSQNSECQGSSTPSPPLQESVASSLASSVSVLPPQLQQQHQSRLQEQQQAVPSPQWLAQQLQAQALLRQQQQIVQSQQPVQPQRPVQPQQPVQQLVQVQQPIQLQQPVQQLVQVQQSVQLQQPVQLQQTAQPQQLLQQQAVQPQQAVQHQQPVHPQQSIQLQQPVHSQQAQPEQPTQLQQLGQHHQQMQPAASQHHQPSLCQEQAGRQQQSTSTVQPQVAQSSQLKQQLYPQLTQQLLTSSLSQLQAQRPHLSQLLTEQRQQSPLPQPPVIIQNQVQAGSPQLAAQLRMENQAQTWQIHQAAQIRPRQPLQAHQANAVQPQQSAVQQQQPAVLVKQEIEQQQQPVAVQNPLQVVQQLSQSSVEQQPQSSSHQQRRVQSQTQAGSQSAPSQESHTGQQSPVVVPNQLQTGQQQQGNQQQVVMQPGLAVSHQPSSVQSQLQAQLRHCQLQQQTAQGAQLQFLHPQIQQLLRLRGAQMVVHPQQPIHIQQGIQAQAQAFQLPDGRIVVHTSQPLQIHPQQQIILHQQQPQVVIQGPAGLQQILQQSTQQLHIQPSQLHIQSAGQVHGQAMRVQSQCQQPLVIQVPLHLPQVGASQAVSVSNSSMPNPLVHSSTVGVAQAGTVQYHAIVPHPPASAPSFLSSRGSNSSVAAPAVVQQAVSSAQGQANEDSRTEDSDSSSDEEPSMQRGGTGKGVSAALHSAVNGPSHPVATVTGMNGRVPQSATHSSSAQVRAPLPSSSPAHTFSSVGLSVCRSSATKMSVPTVSCATTMSLTSSCSSSHTSSSSSSFQHMDTSQSYPISTTVFSQHIHSAGSSLSHSIVPPNQCDPQAAKHSGYVNGAKVLTPTSKESVCTGVNEDIKAHLSSGDKGKTNGVLDLTGWEDANTFLDKLQDKKEFVNCVTGNSIYQIEDSSTQSKEMLQKLARKASHINGALCQTENSHVTHVPMDVDKGPDIDIQMKREKMEHVVDSKKQGLWPINGLTGHTGSQERTVINHCSHNEALVRQTSMEEVNLDSTDSMSVIHTSSSKASNSGGSRPLFSPVSSHNSDASCDSLASSVADSVSSDKHDTQSQSSRSFPRLSSTVSAPPSTSSSVLPEVPLVLTGTIPMSEAISKKNKKKTTVKPTKEKPPPMSKKRKVCGGESVASQTPNLPSVPAAVPAVMEYMCEWFQCRTRRCFANADQVLVHVTKTHVPQLPEAVCRWQGCPILRRKKLSLITHIQDHHCTEAAQREGYQRRLKEAHLAAMSHPPIIAQPQPQPPLVYPDDAAMQAIKRFQSKRPFVEFSEEREGALNKHIRLTAALILRNLARYSSQGRSLIKRREPQLSYVAMSAVESSNAMSNCLWEMLHDK